LWIPTLLPKVCGSADVLRLFCSLKKRKVQPLCSPMSTPALGRLL